MKTLWKPLWVPTRAAIAGGLGPAALYYGSYWKCWGTYYHPVWSERTCELDRFDPALALMTAYPLLGGVITALAMGKRPRSFEAHGAAIVAASALFFFLVFGLPALSPVFVGLGSFTIGKEASHHLGLHLPFAIAGFFVAAIGMAITAGLRAWIMGPWPSPEARGDSGP